jgi:hypothetical protein
MEGNLMGMFRIYQTVYYEGDQVTIHGYHGLDEIYSVKTKTGDIKRGIRENEISLTPPITPEKLVSKKQTAISRGELKETVNQVFEHYINNGDLTDEEREKVILTLEKVNELIWR